MLLKVKCTFSVWVHYTRQGGWQSGSICMVWTLHLLSPAADNYHQEQFQVAIRCHSFVHLPHLLLMRMARGGFLVSKLLMHHPQLFNRLLQYELLTTIFPNQQLQHSVGNWHHWYLTAELIPLALLSSRVPISERQALAEALLEVEATSELQSPQNRFGSGQSKPQFPSVINLSSRLCDLVGVDSVDSWFTMSCLQVYCLWLSGTPGRHTFPVCVMLQQWM